MPEVCDTVETIPSIPLPHFASGETEGPLRKGSDEHLLGGQEYRALGCASD